MEPLSYHRPGISPTLGFRWCILVLRVAESAISIVGAYMMGIVIFGVFVAPMESMGLRAFLVCWIGGNLLFFGGMVLRLLVIRASRTGRERLQNYLICTCLRMVLLFIFALPPLYRMRSAGDLPVFGLLFLTPVLLVALIGCVLLWLEKRTCTAGPTDAQP